MTCPDRGGELNRAFLILGAHLRDKKSGGLRNRSAAFSFVVRVPGFDLA